jgi:hypothetical protein
VALRRVRQAHGVRPLRGVAEGTHGDLMRTTVACWVLASALALASVLRCAARLVALDLWTLVAQLSWFSW